MASPIPHIAITAGEPAGIGLDLCVMLAHQALPDISITVIADTDALLQRAQQRHTPLQLHTAIAPHLGDGSLRVLPIKTAQAVQAGQLNPANSRYVLACLDAALAGCQQGQFHAMVTGPVHKAVINQAGIPFTGHTEYLAEQTATPQVVMMLLGGGMRVALATTHLPLHQVSQHIQQDSLSRCMRILYHDLVHRFGIAKPRVMVAGLNPHAGEQGHLGTEEILVIQPVIQQLQQQGYDLIGPMPADTMFNQQHIAQVDAFLAMYHDQGLAVLKHASFGEAVNITLGLPVIRTSVDHGTALHLAGSDAIDAGSFLQAIQLASQLARGTMA